MIAVHAPSEHTVTAVQKAIDEVLGEFVPTGELWRLHVPVRAHVTEILSDRTPLEDRTAAAIVHRIGFVLGQLEGMDPLPHRGVEKLRQCIDELLGGGLPLRPLG